MKKIVRKRGVRPHKSNPLLVLVQIFVLLAITATGLIIVWALKSSRSEKDSEDEFPSYLRASPEKLDFHSVRYGIEVVGRIKITNTGENEILISSIDSSNSAEFITGKLTSDRLGPGESASVNVRFRPIGPGKTNCTLTVKSSDLGPKDLTVECVGIGLMPSIEVKPGSLDFGNEQRDGVQVPRVIAVVNRGTQALTISRARVNSESFSIYNFQPNTLLKPNQATKLKIVFHPSLIGSNDAVLIFFSNDPRCPQKRVPLYASFKEIARTGAGGRQSMKELEQAKMHLTSAYMKIYSSATSPIKRRDLRKQGMQEFSQWWPVYEQANEALKKKNPSLVDTDFYVENNMLKKR